MTSPRIDWPAPQEIEELVAFLPDLSAEGFRPIKRWHGGDKEEGVMTMPFPEYEEVVQRFFRAASKECWMVRHYQPETAAAMLLDEGMVRDADMSQIRTMMTYCVRGERFCDGHWAALIEGGHMCRLLRRLNCVSSLEVDS